jgi:uncharacterized protein (DUF305 family)
MTPRRLLIQSASALIIVDTSASRRRIAWTAALWQGLLSGTISTIVITLGAPRIGRDRTLDWMEIGTVLLRAESVRVDAEWWNIAGGVLVHQAADLSWAIVFFALGRYWTWSLTAPVLLVLSLPWAAITAAIEYYVILPRLQPLVPMQVPFWTALGVHLTSGLLYPFFPQIRATVTRQSVRWSGFLRGLAIALSAGIAVLCVLELLARANREPAWPLLSTEQRAFGTSFLRRMAAHHEVGVELAQMAAANGSTSELRMLGRLMAANQAGEADIIERWWRSWLGGPMPPPRADEHIPGMPSPATLARLAEARDGPFDAAFIPVMVAHHEGAIQMAAEAWRSAGDLRLRLLADSIRHAQSRQVSAMSALKP